LEDVRADRDLLASAAREAGCLALRFQERGLKHWEKSKGDPVSEADLAADNMLQERLKPARPSYGWLSEESVDDQSRLNKARSFVVDPIDGTRAFVKGRPEFVVSAAVVEDGRPIAAALYDPSTENLWDAALGAGSRLNGRPISVTKQASISGSNLLGDPGQLPDLRRLSASAHTVNSVALRLALCAEGRYDGLVAVRGKWDWDLAAGALILTEAGGKITDWSGQNLIFNQNPPRQPAPIAAGPDLHILLIERLKKGPLS
jgi:myo-inositol-1(or 4)-monophosphatase